MFSLGTARYCLSIHASFLDTPLMRLSIDSLAISISLKNNSAPLLKNDLSFLCSNFVTINEILNELLKVKSDLSLELWVSIASEMERKR